MKKLAIMLLALMLAACGDNHQQTDNKEIKLVIWITYKGAEYEEFRKKADAFSETYYQKNGVKIKIEPRQIPFDDLTTYVRSACMAGKTPDIARIDSLKVLELAYHKVLVKLDKLPNFNSTIERESQNYMTTPFSTNIVDIRNNKGEMERHLYGLPEQISCLALFWNKELFAKRSDELREAGLNPDRAPRDWQELIKYAQVLTYEEKKDGTVNHYYGFGMRNSLWWTVPFFGCYDTRFTKIDQNGKLICLLGDKRSTAALQLKVDLYHKYKIEAGAWKPGSVDPELGFLTKKYAMIMIGPWVVQKFLDRNLNFGVDLIPSITREQASQVGLKNIPKSATNVGGNNFVIFKSSRHKKIAYEFIQYMTSFETQKDWCLKLKQIPVNRRAFEYLTDPKNNAEIKKYFTRSQEFQILQKFIEQSSYAVLPPKLPRYGYIETDVVNPEMELALKNKKTVEQALKDAAKKIEENILSVLNKKP